MATRRTPTDILGPFQLEGVRDTGKTVGDGSYATVKELDFRGLKCVGKKIHALLYNSASPQEKTALLERFASECELLSRLHHPCIVQFLGVYFERGSQLPVMVMEYLHTTLASCLEKGVLPDEITYEILLDVIVGLRYLHEHPPPIVHRDLSANNVLLATNMSAKISDLGMAKILNLSPGAMTLTLAPGTPSYMPPETMVSQPRYTNKVDIFSFGVMMVHMLSGRWPIPGEAFREDPNNPDSNIPLSEFERRSEYLQGIPLDHPLMGLLQQCLNNVQSRRPEAAEIHERIKTVSAELPASFQNRLEMLQEMKSLRKISTISTEENRSWREASELQEVQSLREQNRALNEEVRSLREIATINRFLKNEVDSLRENAARSHIEIESLRTQVERTSVGEGEPVRARSRSALERLGLVRRQEERRKKSLALNAKSKIRWRRCANMPGSMVHPHLVRISNDIYAGGGCNSGKHRRTISRYNSAGDTWSTLPECPTALFGLAELKGKPVLVGGVETGSTPISSIYTLEDSGEWRRSLPPLPTARFYPTVFRYKSFLIACGGITSYTDSRHCTCTTAVEVFSSETSQWYNAEPLPVALHAMSYTIINDTCYLIGGNDGGNLAKQAFCTSLLSLIQRATAQASPQSPTASQSSSPPSAIWRELPRCPCYASTAAGLGGCLLAIGGRLSGIPSTQVHLYSPSTNSWVQLSNADIPKPRYMATATQLASGDIILVGGYSKPDELCNTAFVGSIEF